MDRQGNSRGHWYALFALVFFFVSLGPARGNPSGASVRHGDIRFRSQGDALRIIQNSNRGIIDWNSFSIDNGQTTRFVVPNSRSATLNRVTGASVSRIDGALRSNGQVFLLNPNGVVVGRNGSIDVAGFTASTLDLSNEDFLAGGDLRFRGNSEAAVVNLGSISAFDGDIFLIASTVDNAGLLRAPDGTAALAAGNDVLIKESGSERVFVRGASGGSKNNGVVNSGTIEANVAELKSYGGNVYGMAVKNEGRVAATAVTREGGQIFLRAGGGKVRNTGQLVARKPAQPRGGRVVVDAGKGGTAEVGGTVDAGSGTGIGGSVLVLGENIDVFEGSLILADGETGGGDIRIGGGRRGGDPLIANSENVTMGSGARLNASARSTGNGGEIIVFAENTLDFNGHAAARGGTASGNGGFVEVSGKKALYLPGLVQSVDVSAANGEGGIFLIDPTDIYIGSDGTPGSLTSSPTSSPTILASDVQSFLQNTGSLVIQTASENAENGDVFVTYGSTINWSSNNSLSIFADSKIFVDSLVSIETTGTGSILLDAAKGVDLGSSFAYPGEMTTISTREGNLTVRNDSVAPDSEGISIWNASLSASDGDLSIMGNSRFNGRTGVEIQESQLMTGAGSIAIAGRSEVAHGVFIGGSQIGSTDTGDVDIIGRAVVSNFDHDGIRIDDGAAVNETTISTNNNANISLSGEGSGQVGMAVQIMNPVSARVSPFIGGDGTQNVAFDSLGGNVAVTHVIGNQVKFADPDGVGQSFTARQSDFATFTAMNVGSVDLEVDESIEIQDIKLATNARFSIGSGTIMTSGILNAGHSIEFNVGPGNTSDIQIYSPLEAPAIRFNGGVDGNRILTQGTFELEGVSFTNITEVIGVGMGSDILIDSRQNSVIDLSTRALSTAPRIDSSKVATGTETVATIRGVDFRGYDFISGGQGDDTFSIDLEEGTEFGGVLSGGRGDDKFVFSPGGSVGTIVGGAGMDTVDYSAFESPVFADFGSRNGTQVSKVDTVESVVGGQANDMLTGTNRGDSFRILSDGAGTLNGRRFSNFEILNGAKGDDQFAFFNQATVDRVIGGADRDQLVLNDRNLGGVNSYTIKGDTISRNPTYTFSGVETLKLLLGSGDDTVVTRGNGLRLLLDGGRGFDTLEMGSRRYLQRGPFQLGGSTVVARNFEAPTSRSNRQGGDSEVILTQQTNQVPNPSPKDGKGGKAIDQFSNTGGDSDGPRAGNMAGQSANPPGNAFGAAAAQIIAGQAVVIVIDGDQYLLGAPASLDGTFSLPPIGAIKDLRDSLSTEVWNELAAAIEFDGAMILIMQDGPIAIDLEQVPPPEIAALLGVNLNADATKELYAALEMAIVIPLTSDDGAIAIAVIPAAIAPDIAALLLEHLGDAAFAELTAALDSE